MERVPSEVGSKSAAFNHICSDFSKKQLLHADVHVTGAGSEEAASFNATVGAEIDSSFPRERLNTLEASTGTEKAAAAAAVETTSKADQSPCKQLLHADALIVGTGLQACMCAAALARRGARIVQTDGGSLYGGAYKSMRLSELCDWVEEERQELGISEGKVNCIRSQGEDTNYTLESQARKRRRENLDNEGKVTTQQSMSETKISAASPAEYSVGRYVPAERGRTGPVINCMKPALTGKNQNLYTEKNPYSASRVHSADAHARRSYQLVWKRDPDNQCISLQCEPTGYQWRKGSERKQAEEGCRQNDIKLSCSSCSTSAGTATQNAALGETPLTFSNVPSPSFSSAAAMLYSRRYCSFFPFVARSKKSELQCGAERKRKTTCVRCEADSISKDRRNNRCDLRRLESSDLKKETGVSDRCTLLSRQVSFSTDHQDIDSNSEQHRYCIPPSDVTYQSDSIPTRDSACSAKHYICTFKEAKSQIEPTSCEASKEVDTVRPYLNTATVDNAEERYAATEDADSAAELELTGQQQALKEELLRSTKFSIDLTPRVLYSHSDIAHILVKCGASQYLEFRPIDTPVFLGEIEASACKNEDKKAKSDDNDLVHTERRRQEEAETRRKKSLSMDSTEKIVLCQQIQDEKESGALQHQEREATVADKDGAYIESLSPAHAAQNGWEGVRNNAIVEQITESQRRSENDGGGSAMLGRRVHSIENLHKEKGTSFGHLQQPLRLEQPPLTRSDIFASSSLTLKEKRLLMKFVSSVASNDLSLEYISAARSWNEINLKLRLQSDELEKDKGIFLAEKSDTGGSVTTEKSSILFHSGDICCDGGRIRADISWKEYLKKYNLTVKLEKYISYGICLCDVPLESKKPASSSGLHAFSGRCSNDSKVEVEDEALATDFTAAEGQVRLLSFVKSIGLYGNRRGAWLYPLFGTADLPQALARVASLSDAIYMLRAGIVRIKMRCLSDASVCREKASHSSCGAVADNVKKNGEERSTNRRGVTQHPNCFEIFRNCDVLDVSLANGETIRTRFIFFEPDTIPALDTVVQAGSLNAQPPTSSSASSLNSQSSNSATFADFFFSDSTASLSESANCEGHSLSKPDGHGCQKNGRARQLGESSKLSQIESEPGSRNEAQACIRQCTKYYKSAACHLIAICRGNVLDGPGFRLCVCTVHQEQSVIAEEYPEATLITWPVHVLQTDASCATTPAGYTLIHMTHVHGPGVNLCGCTNSSSRLRKFQIDPRNHNAKFPRPTVTSSNSGRDNLIYHSENDKQPCGMLVTVLLRLLARLETHSAPDTCVFLSSFLSSTLRPCVVSKLLHQTARNFRGIFKHLDPRWSEDVVSTACSMTRPSKLKTTNGPIKSSGDFDGWGGQRTDESTSDLEEARRPKRDNVPVGCSETYTEAREEKQLKAKEKGQPEFQIKKCGFLMLSGVPVMPLFLLSEEPKRCQTLLEILMDRPVSLSHLIPAYFWQNIEEMEKQRKLLKEPYEKLAEIVGEN